MFSDLPHDAVCYIVDTLREHGISKAMILLSCNSELHAMDVRKKMANELLKWRMVGRRFYGHKDEEVRTCPPVNTRIVSCLPFWAAGSKLAGKWEWTVVVNGNR